MTDQETINELRAALRVALRLLESVDADANNVQLDIQRFRRAHHRAVDGALRGTNAARGQ